MGNTPQSGEGPAARGRQAKNGSQSANFRFAIATFDHRRDAILSAQRLGAGPKPLDAISFLGLQNVLSGATVPALVNLPFACNPAPLVCSRGVVSDLLVSRLTAGAPSLQAALAHWLVPRLAAQLQKTVNDGKVVLWVRIADDADEQRAYRILMDAACTSVGVHDLVGC